MKITFDQFIDAFLDTAPDDVELEEAIAELEDAIARLYEYGEWSGEDE